MSVVSSAPLAVRALLSASVLASLGCSGSPKATAADTHTISKSEASVEIGVPSGDDGLEFQPLLPMAELRLQSFGQGGTHVLLGVRCRGFGNRAYVGIDLQNLGTGAEVASPAPVRPQLLYCPDGVSGADAGTADAAAPCDLVPLLALTSGLFAPGSERNGVVISIHADVSNDSGEHAVADQTAVLSTADL